MNKNRILAWLPWICAFFFFALRFLRPGESVFILDEPLFQIKVDDAIAAHSIPLTSFRGSSIPLPYGAGAIWFYYLARFFTWKPECIVLFQLVFQIAGAVIFLSALARTYGREAAGWCALLMATSPLLFFLSRHPWDVTLLIPLGATPVWLISALERGATPWLVQLLAGLAVGYGLNVHLMFGPVALAVGITFLTIGIQKHGLWSRKTILPLGCFALGALLLFLPYALEAMRLAQAEHALANAKIKNRWGDGRNLWWLFQRSVLFASVFNAQIYLSDVRTVFYAFCGHFWAFLFRNDLFGWFGKLAAWGSAFGVVLSLLRRCWITDPLRRRWRSDPLRFFAASSFFLTLLVYQYLNIPTAPHYFVPIWWFVFLGIAWAISRLGGWRKKVFLATLALGATVNGAFDLAALSFVHENKGARSLQMGVVVEEQMRAIRELCGAARAAGMFTVKLDIGQVYLGTQPFAFLPRHMPECQQIHISIQREPEGADFRFRHPADSTTKVDLILEKTPPR